MSDHGRVGFYGTAMIPIAFIVLLGCSGASDKPDAGTEKRTSTEHALTVKSEAFGPGAAIPLKFTCEGENVSPPLQWHGTPENAKSFAIIVDDPDAPDPTAPKMTWVHWVIYNIPAKTTLLPAGASTTLPPGALDGVNDWKETGYRGPCPPIGIHRYFHKIYALSEMLPDLGHPTKAKLLEAMEGKIVAHGALIGTCSATVE